MKREKYCVIIDTYPQSRSEEEILLRNLKLLKDQEIDVLLTSHSVCTPEIIQNSTYFIFEKKNDYYFLDSHILNENIEGVENPVYLKYLYIGNEVFRDRLVITGWSVSVVSQMVNAIRFLHGKGYEYAFYFVSDFVCPEDIKIKLGGILEKSKKYRNYFIKNSPIFSSWYAGFFFGFTIDQKLIDRIQLGDFSDNKFYQKSFPNCSGEDVILKLWGNDENLIEDHSKLDEIFGKNGWNLVNSTIREGSSSLHSSTSSSIYADPQSGEFCIMLDVSKECPCDEVYFRLQILDLSGNLLFEREVNLQKFHWYKENVTNFIYGQEKVIFKKYVADKENPSLFFEDSINIERNSFSTYSFLKNFQTI